MDTYMLAIALGRLVQDLAVSLRGIELETLRIIYALGLTRSVLLTLVGASLGGWALGPARAKSERRARATDKVAEPVAEPVKVSHAA